MKFWPFARRHTFVRLSAARVSKGPYRAALSYLFGSLVYCFPLAIDSLSSGLSGWTSMVWLRILYLLGSALFTIGGGFEYLESQASTSEPQSMSKWAAISNGFGGVLFFVASVVGIWSSWWFSFLRAMGSMGYAVGSVLSLFMWTDQKLGLSSWAALSHAVERRKSSASISRPSELSGPPLQGQGFSRRGVFFVVFYCTVAAVVVYNSGLYVHLVPERHRWRPLGVYNEVLPFFLMQMVLLVHSAVVQTPSRDNQPFHALIMATRALALTTGANVFHVFACRLPDVTRAATAGCPRAS